MLFSPHSIIVSYVLYDFTKSLQLDDVFKILLVWSLTRGPQMCFNLSTSLFELLLPFRASRPASPSAPPSTCPPSDPIDNSANLSV